VLLSLGAFAPTSPTVRPKRPSNPMALTINQKSAAAGAEPEIGRLASGEPQASPDVTKRRRLEGFGYASSSNSSCAASPPPQRVVAEGGAAPRPSPPRVTGGGVLSSPRKDPSRPTSSAISPTGSPRESPSLLSRGAAALSPRFAALRGHSSCQPHEAHGLQGGLFVPPSVPPLSRPAQIITRRILDSQHTARPVPRRVRVRVSSTHEHKKQIRTYIYPIDISYQYIPSIYT